MIPKVGKDLVAGKQKR